MSFQRFGLRSCSAAVLIAAAALAAVPVVAAAATEEPQSLVSDAKQRIEKGDFKGAEIQLRNAARANPSDPATHIDLADLYLKMQNLPAAEAEARLAQQDKGPADEVDPLLAQALLQQNKMTELFRDIKPGQREAKAESQVRLTLGLGHLMLQEVDQAAPLLHDAERLDETAVRPKTAMAQLLLVQQDVADAQKEIAAASAIAPEDVSVLRVSALVLRAEGDSDGALAKLNALLASRPDDVATLATRADLEMSQNKLTEAQTDLDRALKLAPNNVSIVFLDGVLLARQGKLKEADAQLSQVGTDFNSIPYGYYLQGVVKYQLGQYEQAAASLSKYSARFPKAVLPRQLLARLALSKRDYSGAIGDLKPVLDADPKDAESALLLAQAYLASGRRGDALDLYQRAAQAQPNDPTAAVNLAEMETQVGQIQQGLEELDKLAQTAGGAALAGPALVISDLRSGHVSDAARSAQALVDRNPRDLVAQSLLGTVRMVEGKYSEAAAIFKAIADKDRTLLGAQRGLAQADIGLDKLDEAKAVLQGLLQQHPGSIVDQVALARIDVRQPDEAAAADVLRKAQRDAATDPTPGLALLQIYGEEKAWDKAQSYGRELELQFPGDPQVVSTIAALRAAAGDAKGAAAEYAQLPTATPNDSDILVRYAEYQSQAGDKAGARATLGKALSASPKSFELMSQLANFDFDNGGFDKALATAQSFAPGEQAASDLIAAGVYERAHRLDDAVATLTTAMKRNSQLPVALKLANDLFDKGERSQAVETLRAWTKGHPGDYEAQLVLAGFYDRLSDPASAQQAYEDAYKSAPTNWVIANNLAEFYATKSDPRARALGEQAYYLAPSPQTADTYGWALVRTGGAAEGLRLLRIAQAGLPSNAVVLYHLAVALKDTGDTAEARKLLQKVVGSGAAFDDENAAKQLLEQLQRG